MDGDSVKLVVDSLANGTSHDFKVIAYNAAGDGAESDEVTATPRGGPRVPTSVAAENDHGTLVVTWTNPTVTGGSELIGHLVAGDGAFSTAPGATTRARLTELPLGAEVDAVNPSTSRSSP